MLRKLAFAIALVLAWPIFGQELVNDCNSCMVVVQAAGSPTFFYVATTVDVNGLQSAFSNQVSASLAQGQHNVNLTWTIPTVPTGGAAIAGFNVFRSTTTGGPYTQVNTTLLAATVTTYTDSFVLPNAPTLAAPTTN